MVYYKERIPMKIGNHRFQPFSWRVGDISNHKKSGNFSNAFFK